MSEKVFLDIFSLRRTNVAPDHELLDTLRRIGESLDNEDSADDEEPD